MASFREQYKRLKELGSGAFGSAFLVQRRDAKDVLHVAKIIKLPHLSEKEREAAQREAQYLEQVSHPNIIGYVTSFLEEKRLHIIMEFADRGDLADKIRRRREATRPLSELSVMRYFVQLAQALEHIHGLRILHRDLKPMNVFLSGPDEQVKLGDFGVARVIDSATHGAQTQIGTPHYLPPEVINMQSYGTSSDLWSLGVVTYELMAFRVPFSAPSLPAVALQICGAVPEPLPERYSQPLRQTVFGLLEKEPRRRPALGELLRAPRGAGDAWAAAVRRQCQGCSRASGAGSAASDATTDTGSAQSSSREERNSDPMCARRSDVQGQGTHKSEAVVLQALERARLGVLEDRRFARQRALAQRGSTDEASGSSAGRAAAERRSSAAVGQEHMHALSRASCEAVAERKRLVAKFERCPAPWMQGGLQREVACA